MSQAPNYPFPDSFPPEKLKRLVNSSDFELFCEMLLARAQARQAQLVACEGGFDVMRQIQGGIREDLWLRQLPDVLEELEAAQVAEAQEEARQRGSGVDMFGVKPTAPRGNPLDRPYGK